MRGLFARSLVLAFGLFALVFAIEFAVEWWRAGQPGLAEMSWAGVRNDKLVDLLSPMARAYNNVLAMLIATIGLAIPLTANMHTPKLIDMFLRDRVNRWVLSFMALGAAHTLWVAYIVGPNFAPTWAIAAAVYMAIAGWALLIPYFFYVVRFLDPSRIVTRLREETQDIVDQVAAGKHPPVLAQRIGSQRIGQLGTIVIKSLERDDRDVAREAVWALKQVLDHYEAHKRGLPAAWYTVDRDDFVGFSDEALDMLSDSKTWYEMKCLQQLELGFQRAMSEASDVVSTFSDALRVIAVRAHERDDEQALRLCVRFFNNYLREAIKARHLRAVYDVFHQYRRLARELTARPKLLREIGGHFAYYAVMARTSGMLFAPQLAIFDLGYVVRRAYEQHSEAAPDLLRLALDMPHRHGDDLHSLAVKAKVILGSFFQAGHFAAEAELVRANLRDVDAATIAVAQTTLLAADRSFFEVTDRQLNLEYVPPERREALAEFCASLTSTSSG